MLRVRQNPTFYVALIVVGVFLFFKILSDQALPFEYGKVDTQKYRTEAEWISEFPKNNVKQNNENLVKYVKDHFLIPPTDKEYNLNNPKGDPYAGEYQWVRKILKGKRNGFFIECGANDGEFLSTTLLLERDYQWSGLLIEPDTIEFAKLKKKNRKAWLSNTCLSTSGKIENVTFLHNTYSQGQGMLNAARPLMQNKQWTGLPTNDKGDAKLDPKLWVKTEATCVPLFTLLSAINVTEIDLFTLDVQGSEMGILNTLPFDEVFIKIFSIEYVLIFERELRHFMREKNYKFVRNITSGMTYDYLFVHQSVSIEGIKGLRELSME